MDQWHDIILQDVALSKPSEAEEDHGGDGEKPWEDGDDHMDRKIYG
jgi:hypothetical protein